MNSIIERMTPFLAMDVAERAHQLENDGIDVVRLEVGEPDFKVYPKIIEALKDALSENRTHYTDAFGDIELRQAICQLYFTEYGVKISPERVMVTSDTSPALMMALQVICDIGDEVIFSDPGYPCYRDFALACHAEPRTIGVVAEKGFQIDPTSLETTISDRTRVIFINSPMNPAGTLAETADLEKIAGICKIKDITIFSDEIYHGLVYNGKQAHSILEFTDNAFVFNGFSKRFAMTGLRLGYVIIPEKYLTAMKILQQNLFICAGAAVQRAGLKAINLLLEDKEFQCHQHSLLAEYDARRKFTLNRLKGLGFLVTVEPEGAFYVLADASRYTQDSRKFAFDLLERAHVGVTPGTDFGTNGNTLLRFAYTVEIPRLREAFNRLAEF